MDKKPAANAWSTLAAVTGGDGWAPCAAAEQRGCRSANTSVHTITHKSNAARLYVTGAYRTGLSRTGLSRLHKDVAWRAMERAGQHYGSPNEFPLDGITLYCPD